jgi:hypothetical protein
MTIKHLGFVQFTHHCDEVWVRSTRIRVRCPLDKRRGFLDCEHWNFPFALILPDIRSEVCRQYGSQNTNSKHTNGCPYVALLKVCMIHTFSFFVPDQQHSRFIHLFLVAWHEGLYVANTGRHKNSPVSYTGAWKPKFGCASGSVRPVVYQLLKMAPLRRRDARKRKEHHPSVLLRWTVPTKNHGLLRLRHMPDERTSMTG